jgi:hypothetical protein
MDQTMLVLWHLGGFYISQIATAWHNALGLLSDPMGCHFGLMGTDKPFQDSLSDFRNSVHKPLPGGSK